MSETRSIPALTSRSRLLLVYWWFLSLGPALNLVFALVSSLTGSSAGGLVTIPLLFATLLLAPVVVVRTLASPALTSIQKTACVVLGLAALPMFLLVQALWWSVGSREATPSFGVKVTLAVVAVLWVLPAWWGRAVIRKESDIPLG